MDFQEINYNFFFFITLHHYLGTFCKPIFIYYFNCRCILQKLINYCLCVNFEGGGTLHKKTIFTNPYDQQSAPPLTIPQPPRSLAGDAHGYSSDNLKRKVLEAKKDLL